MYNIDENINTIFDNHRTLNEDLKYEKEIIEYISKQKTEEKEFTFIVDGKEKVYKTINWFYLPDEYYNYILDCVFYKPSFKNVIKEFNKLKNGKKINQEIIERYYVWDLMLNTKFNDKMSIMQRCAYKETLVPILKHLPNPKIAVYKTLKKNIMGLFRLGAHSKKVSNFPLNEAKAFLKKYNINNMYYDYSCGWGTRLLASLSNNINYFGTDPNVELTKRLIKMGNDYKKVTNNKTDFYIYAQGSEIFIPELKNKIGVSFSSPPYFKLENYNYKSEFNKNFDDYEYWLNEYWKKTVNNIKEYLIDGGVFALNIKSYKTYDLEKDMNEIINDEGFNFLKTENLKNNTPRPTVKKEFIDVDENIYVYTKGKYIKSLDNWFDF